MGRVLLYVTTGCSHCVRAKKLLDSKNIPYVTIDLAEHPERKQEMVMASGGRKTVPQIFFNYEHIGGADDLYALDIDGILDDKLKACMEEHPELDEELEKKKETKKEPEVTGSIADEMMLLQYIDEMMHPLLGIRRKKGGLFSKTKKFKGNQLVSWLKERKSFNAQQAVALGNELLEKGYFRKSTKLGKFGNDDSRYVFASDEYSNILNYQRQWVSTKRSANEIAKDLQRRMMKLSDLYITSDGRGVDYTSCAVSSAFRAYRIIAMELQAADISSLKGDEASAFWLNLYNAMIIHANIVVGPPKNMFERSRFFGTIGYLINGFKFTLSEIEHAILRGNRKPPAAFSKLFKKSDPRKEYVIQTLDPRIHFALVCGAKSCPPIRIYDCDNLNTALQWATEGFCSEEVSLNRQRNSVTLSRIFQWYAKDFGRTNRDILLWISDYLPPKTKDELLTMLKGKVKIKYSTYDWDVNNRYGIEEEQLLASSDNASYSSNISLNSWGTTSGGSLAPGSTVVDGRGKIREHEFQEWEIEFSKIEILDKIGQGGYGEVYLGKYNDEDVAVKNLIHDALTEKETNDFFREIGVMINTDHPNVLKLIGVSLNEPNFCVITEYMPLGDLHDVLRKYLSLSWDTKLSFALGIAKGMEYLHGLSPPIVHRDLKALNVLVDANYQVKVADFGLSKAIPQEKTQATNTKMGTLNWLAPEVLSEISPYTTKADVFSYGMVLYEILTGKTPYSGYTPIQIVRALDSGKRPVLPDGDNKLFCDLIERCWNQDHTKRPEFSEIVNILEEMSM